MEREQVVITKTDFTGFTFDGIHTSELNVYRVSDGDRYDEELIPEINDRTTEIPGNNGEYFWGSNYGKRSFTIKIAYDEVTEVQFRKIRRLFSTRKVVPIIFDERPYKVYYVKMESPIELNYICFDEPEYEWISNFISDPDDESNEINPWVRGSINHKYYTGRKRRIYKGEGTIELVAYYPYAHQLYKVLDAYMPVDESSESNEWYENGIVSRYANVDEWAVSSGLLDKYTFDYFSLDRPIPTTGGEMLTTGQYNYKIPVYNPGDEDTGFYLYIPYSNNKIEPQNGEYIIINGDTGTLVLNPFTKPDTRETGIIINTVNRLIEGVRWDDQVFEADYKTPAWITTGNIYNDHIEKGDFPKILKSEWFSFDEDETEGDWLGPSQAIWINCKQGADAKIHYNYLYY